MTRRTDMSSLSRKESALSLGVAALAAYLMFPGALGAATQPYAAAAATYSFVDIHTDGTAILKNADDETVDGSGIGFTSQLFGQNYDITTRWRRRCGPI
ncbi:MAG: hypothetical protein LAQ30_21100 [Acidobacteriia bacterium]|nr:hypothetical protein [Terriglobia bacterium]